jgi:ABC-2 type transport system ATP-binding protein
MTSGIVKARNLGKMYGGVPALRGLDLDVEKGSVVGLLGPNGAGKTTTLGLLCGWVRPSSGVVELMGIPVSRLHLLRGRVAALPQDCLFPEALPLIKELAHFARLMGFSAKDANFEAAKVLERVGLEEQGRKKSSELSHGMHKRVRLAQALLGKPELVFLDEPVSGLDPSNARRIKDIILELTGKITFMLSSHNLIDVQELCTHGLILDHGNIVAQGTMSMLRGQNTELTFVLAEQCALPDKLLHEAFGEDGVDFSLGQSLRIKFSLEDKPADVVRTVMEILLAHDVPVVEIHQGRSLERSFLSYTQQKS